MKCCYSTMVMRHLTRYWPDKAQLHIHTWMGAGGPSVQIYAEPYRLNSYGISSHLLDLSRNECAN